MTNEEFQMIVLEKLGNIDTRFDKIEARFDNLETRFDGLEIRFDNLETRFDGLEAKVDSLETRFDGLETKVDRLEIGQGEIKREIRVITEQTVELSEFRFEVNEKLDRLTDEFNTMEIITSKNWTDIAKLKAAR